MLKLIFRGTSFGAAMIWASIGLAQSDDGNEANPVAEEIDPVAIKWVEAATGTLAAQSALAVNWFVSFDEVIDGREKITHIRSGQVALRRNYQYYAYAEQDSGAREYFFDGLGLTVYLPEEKAYVHKSFLGDFEQLADMIGQEHDVALPIWQILVPDAASELLSNVTSATYLGQRRVAGAMLHHVAMSTYDYDVQLWISDDAEKPVPVMMVGTEPYAQGWPQFRAYFSDWDFAPELDEDTFTFYPDEDDIRLNWPKSDDQFGQDALNGEASQ